MQKLVGIGQMVASSDPDDILTAPNLGSCLGVAIYDKKTRKGAVIHCMLPLSKSNPDKAQNEPYLYVDTGLVMMLEQMLKSGSSKSDLVIAAAGCSNINDANNVFEIGKKNHTVFRKVMWKNNLLIKAEHIGQDLSRTFSLHLATGEVWVKTGGESFKIV